MCNSNQIVIRQLAIAALSVAVLFALATEDANAAAFQLKENSAKSLGRAFAGAASAPDDASVVAANPAAMRLLEGRQFQFDVNAISFSAEFNGGGHYLGGAGGATGGGKGGDAGQIIPVPSAYFHLPFGERDQFHFGSSLTVPFGLTTEYDDNWVGRYQGIKTHIQAVDLGVSLSYDVNPYLSFGASIFAQKMDVEFTTAVDFGTALYAGGAAQMGFRPGNADGFNRLKGDSVEVGYAVGLLATPVEGTNVALSYRSKVEHDIDDGKSSYRIPSNAKEVLDQAQPGAFVDSKGRATIPLPATASISVTHHVNDRWTVMADVTRTAWSKLDIVKVEYYSGQNPSELGFQYRDATAASLGVDYRLNDKVTLRAGISYDQTPTTDEHRDVRVPDNTRKLAALGLSWRPNNNAEFNFGYLHVFTRDPRITEVSSTGNTLAGTYNIGGDVLGAAINYKF